MVSKYWSIKLPKVKNGRELKKLKKKIDKLYEGKWSKKDIIKHSAYVHFAKEYKMPKKEQKRIGEGVWREYKFYKKLIKSELK